MANEYRETLREVADALELAATDLESGNIEQAGREMKNAAWSIQGYLDDHE